ncbi:MAG: hypothetical protein ACRDZQ_06895, partial [Acidimicrobiales bacterium]
MTGVAAGVRRPSHGIPGAGATRRMITAVGVVALVAAAIAALSLAGAHRTSIGGGAPASMSPA